MSGQLKTDPFAAALIVIPALAMSFSASAMDDWNIDGEHGNLQVHGLLIEGACHLDMTSQFQQVSLGTTPLNLLAKVGDEGQPVRFQLKLRGCSRSGGNQGNRYTGTTTWDAIQPVVTISFSGVTDPLLPGLFKINGVSGIGLKITDPQGERLRPGERGEPLLITPGDNLLNYQVALVRTPAALTTGDFSALARFEVSYD
ncbi:fimbrial protein [Enterobacter hormaechei]